MKNDLIFATSLTLISDKSSSKYYIPMILHIWPHIFQDIFLVVATIFFFLDAIKGQQSRGLFLEHNNMETRLQKRVEYVHCC